MKLSARNQFAGTVTKVNEGAVNGIVSIDVNGTIVSSTISMSAIRELGLEPGKKAYAVVKATEVMVGRGEHLPLSARNQFPGKVISVEKGAVNSIVRISALGGRYHFQLRSGGPRSQSGRGCSGGHQGHLGDGWDRRIIAAGGRPLGA